MRALTERRTEDTPDEWWILEHAPVYTQGQAGLDVWLTALQPDIPLVRSDRGGQVTYHGPGQIMLYGLVDLRRLGLTVRSMVFALEEAVLGLLSHHGVRGERRDGAPGVYVEGAKVAALGLRVRHGCTYHGLALNVAMDLGPFAGIVPCGLPGLAVTQTRDLGILADHGQLAHELVRQVMICLDQQREMA